MAYSFQTFTLNQVLTAAQMNQVEVNIRDHLHGQASVVFIDQTAIDDAQVGQAELKTTTASASVSILGNGSAASISLTGGTYSWWTASATNPAGAGKGICFGNGNTSAGVVGFKNTGSTSPADDGTAFTDERYVQASPPYTLGPLFIFVMLDSGGNILGISVAPDPPWAYHGPTNITPHRYEGDKAFRDVKTFDGMTWDEIKAAGDSDKIQAVLSGDLMPVSAEIELTLDYKDSDMNVVPHPWSFNTPEYLAGKTVVLLEPGTTMMERLLGVLQESHASEVRTMVQDGFFKIDNTPIEMEKSPQGIQIVKSGFKNSKASIRG